MGKNKLYAFANITMVAENSMEYWLLVVEFDVFVLTRDSKPYDQHCNVCDVLPDRNWINYVNNLLFTGYIR